MIPDYLQRKIMDDWVELSREQGVILMIHHILPVYAST